MTTALVSTCNYLLAVHLETKTVQIIENHRSEYYGISWFRDATDLSLSHSGLDNNLLINISDYAQSERGWISTGNVNSRKVLSQPHQILCTPDGRIICTNTGRNCITMLDHKSPDSYQEIKFNDNRWDRPSINEVHGDHLNSIFLYLDKLYILGHGHNKGSKLFTVSYPNLELLETQSLKNITGLHNIFVNNDGQKISCNSNIGGLIDIEPNGHSTLWRSGNNGYTRGLAATIDYIVIGESEQSTREKRPHSWSGLFIVDRKTWKTLDYISLGPYGNVHEVRLADTEDLAHHEGKFQGLELLLSNSLPEKINLEKIKHSNEAYYKAYKWKDYQIILGNFISNKNNQYEVEENDLCIAILKNNSYPSAIEFNYELYAKPNSHISAITNYFGNGDDSKMIALLMHWNGQSASLTPYIHDGKAWKSLNDLAIISLPLIGRLKFTFEKERVLIELNASPIRELTNTDLMVSLCNAGSVGVRFSHSCLSF
jgi:hypothetical protein